MPRAAVVEIEAVNVGVCAVVRKKLRLPNGNLAP
jgi:hypothetical protein